MFACSCGLEFGGETCEIVLEPVPTIEAVAVDGIEGMTTYHLRVQLPPTMSNVYSVYGDGSNVPYVPAAYMDDVATSNIAAPNMALFEVIETLEYSSYLTVGPGSSGNPWPSMGSVDPTGALANWDAEHDLTLGAFPSPLDDFAVFWMEPSGPQDYEALYGAFENGPLIAQLTLPSEQAWFVRLGVQGQSTDETQADQQYQEIVWSQQSASGECATGMTGNDCTEDIDECLTAGCSTPCYNGIGEAICETTDACESNPCVNASRECGCLATTRTRRDSI